MTNKEIISNNLSYWKERTANSQLNFSKKKKAEIDKQLKKYYKAAMENSMAAFESTYYKLMETVKEGKEPTPADLYKLDKYWESQAQLKKILEKLGDKEVNLLQRKFIEQWKGIYNELALRDGMGFNQVDDATARQLINAIWCSDGKSWSQRVWGNVDKLQQALNDSLLDCVITGKKTSELKKLLQTQFNIDFNRANTLVQTEMAHIQTQSALQRYKDNGVEEVMVWADKDERRCDICGELHQKKYSVYDAIPIPAHPNCRCCIVPVRKSLQKGQA